MNWFKVKLSIRGFKLGIEPEINEKFKFEFKSEQRENIMEIIKNLLRDEGFCMISNLKINSIKTIPSCWGCREDQPNQLAHMDYGGCMYDDSEDNNY